MRNFGAAALFVAGALVVSLAPGAASPGTQLSTSGGSANAGTSFATSATATLSGVDELNGFDVTLNYNAAVAVPTSITLNSAWTIPLDAGTIGGSTIHVAASRLGFCTGSCPLFTINWSAASAGSFQVSPSTYTLAGRQSGAPGNLTQTSANPGTVIVNGDPPTATNTPITPTTNTPVPPATNTPVTPATNTAVPVTVTNTPVRPTNTPVTSPNSTPAGPTAAAEPSGTAPAPPSTPISQAPTAPAVIGPSADGQTDPPADGPVTAVQPTPEVTDPASPSNSNPIATSGDSTSLPPAIGAPITASAPLPPQTGNAIGQGAEFPWSAFGWGLMAVAVLILGFELRRGRRPGGRFADALDHYFDGLQNRRD